MRTPQGYPVRVISPYIHRWSSQRLGAKAWAHVLILTANILAALAAKHPGVPIDTLIRELRSGGGPRSLACKSGRGPNKTLGTNAIADLAWAALIADGDPRAVVEFLRRFRPTIEGKLRQRFGAQAQRLEDDGFLDRLLFRDDGKPSAFWHYHAESPLIGWIVKVAENRLRDILRREARRFQHLVDMAVEDGANIPVDDEGQPVGDATPARPTDDEPGDPADEAACLEYRHNLEEATSAALAEISPTNRLVLTLIVVDGIDQQDVGGFLGLSPSAVSRRKAAILATLKQALADLAARWPEEFIRASPQALRDVLRRESCRFPIVRQGRAPFVAARLAATIDSALRVLTTHERDLLAEVDLFEVLMVAFGLCRPSPSVERRFRGAFESLEKFRQDCMADDEFADRFEARLGPCGGYLWLVAELRQTLGRSR